MSATCLRLPSTPCPWRLRTCPPRLRSYWAREKSSEFIDRTAGNLYAVELVHVKTYLRSLQIALIVSKICIEMILGWHSVILLMFYKMTSPNYRGGVGKPAPFHIPHHIRVLSNGLTCLENFKCPSPFDF